MLCRSQTPLKKITVSGTPDHSAHETLAVITEAVFEAESARARHIGETLVAELPTSLPSIVIKRRLADAGIDAEVNTIVRFV